MFSTHGDGVSAGPGDAVDASPRQPPRGPRVDDVPVPPAQRRCGLSTVGAKATTRTPLQTGHVLVVRGELDLDALRVSFPELRL